jgi:transcriptional regulator with XRE-family HTH domain
MAGTLDRVRQMLEFPGVVKKSAAAAMGLRPSAVSRILSGERDISADEFARLEAYFRQFRGEGLEEGAAGFFNQTSALSPLYPARAVGDSWVVDLAADPIHRSRPPGPFQGRAEVFGFYAPDNTAWPRFKAAEIVWVSPADLALAGDDVFLSTGEETSKALKGFVAELAPPIEGTARYKEYSTGKMREHRNSVGTILKVAPRDR